MLKIIQSNKTEQLLKNLIGAYQTQQRHVFDEFVVLVPSMVIGEWLQKSIADELGISTLISHSFWGQYQVELMSSVLKKYDEHDPQGKIDIPEVAVLSTRIMQWRIFGYLLHNKNHILADEKHPLFALISKLIKDKQSNSKKGANEHSNPRLWQLAEQLAKVFNRYLTHRNDWLTTWSTNQHVDITNLIKQKETLTKQFSSNDNHIDTPDWLEEHYHQLETAQQFLWHHLFADVYQYRMQIENRFWQGLSYFATQYDSHHFANLLNLPNCLYLFTIEQLPLDEFAFMQRLSQYLDIQLFHYNPSQAYWADIVDKHWFQHQQIVNPSIIYLRDYGHTLLSRLGKQERETFATLSSLSGNKNDSAQAIWQNDFVYLIEEESQQATNKQTHAYKPSLLQRLQQDVLVMDDNLTRLSLERDVFNDLLQKNRHWDFDTIDNSLSIHSCHSLQRQLEVLRGMIGKWLNESTLDNKGNKITRHISDIVVMLPDVDSHHDMINSVFVDGVGQDGLTLPARVTGVVDKAVRQLWQAICGYYQLLGQEHSRFEANEFYEWLLLPPVYEGFELSFEQMSRGCELLTEAGFIRGFDEAHLQATLDSQDTDYRFSFAYALDRLVLGLTMPEAGLTDIFYNQTDDESSLNKEKTLPLESVSLSDAVIIDTLCKIYTALNKHRNEYFDDDSGQPKQKTAHEWLNQIEAETIHPYFANHDQSRAMRTIFKAMNGMKKNLRANYVYQQVGNTNQNHHPAESLKNQLSIKELPFQLSFILESIEAELESQQVSAEPTGVITFARFGAVRSIPFKLVVMLNMNLSEFPRQERDDRYDLMKAGLARRGDRRADDDDNGAFLNALLCAKQNCWIFYNGQSLTDTNEHLPANPVGELIQFLTSEISWQGIDKNLQQDLREHITARLLTRHAPLPFSDQRFVINEPDSKTGVEDEKSEKQLLADFKLKQQKQFPPPPIWTQVYHQLHQTINDNKEDRPIIELTTLAQYQAMAQLLTQHQLPIDNNNALMSCIPNIDFTNKFYAELPTQINIEQFASQITHTGKLYLRHHQIHIADTDDEDESLEPLALNQLTRYQLNDSLIESLGNNTDTASYPTQVENLLFTPLIPAGVARYSTMQNMNQQINQQLYHLQQKLAENPLVAAKLNTDKLITAVDEHNLQLSLTMFGKKVNVELKGIIPNWQVNDANKHIEASDFVDNSTNVSDTTNQQPKVWVNVLATKPRDKHLLKFWLRHLFWQICRGTSLQQVAQQDGMSIWQFAGTSSDVSKIANADIIQLPAIEKSHAINELKKWIIYAAFAKQYPLILMPKYAFIYLDKQYKAQAKGNDYQPRGSDFIGWSAPVYNAKNPNQPIYDSCSQHDIWQYILEDNKKQIDVNQAITIALSQLAETMFSELFNTVEGL
ncbi:exodeoxyribonuclease V subunit gamma [Psychrobacter sp. HD31]|uniref:exodeoxyribonuclease V subunit gamma n=1 Tax=Psychrobacter sp. HD31 TaxID=3112003 RepID=UPI003DA66D58